MPVFVEDPAQFSKQRLKSELIANSVTLPDAESKKQVYVDLYMTHIGQRRAADFSSDEEDDQVMQTAGEEEETEDPEMLDCKSLTDDELKASLLQHGVRAGPIVGSTRALYERKLEALLQPAAQPQLNGTGDTGQYSDSEEDQDTSEQAGPETVSHLDQNQQDIQIERRCPLSTRADRGTSESDVERPQPSFHWEPVTDVLMDIFPDTQPTPTGIVATRRRPIKGAAGRPVQFKYPDSPLSPSTRDRQKLERVLVPLWVQVVVFLIIVCLLYFIYACVEDSLDNPFGAFLENLSPKTGDVEVSLEPGDEESLLLSTEPVDTHVLEPLTEQE